MKNSVKYVVALIAGAAAVGAVAVVAMPILGRSMALDSAATMQQIVPTVVGSPADDVAGAANTTSSWQIDPSSWVEYRLSAAGEQLVSGSTSDISGMIGRTADAVTEAEFMVDLSTLSGEDPAQDLVLRGLIAATGGNSTATFVLTQPIPLETEGGDDETVPVSGILTVRGVSNSVSLDALLETDGETVTLSGSIPVDLADYGITVPGAASGRSTIEVSLTAAPVE
ncbi:YceI family protein [Herbiconiux sp. YIM B11900]|uniref:YceI family protein n=1 Tax=Herbiconiux sp. YIM B11900 TaxID=3404131 RepID=UPI003F857A54